MWGKEGSSARGTTFTAGRILVHAGSFLVGLRSFDDGYEGFGDDLGCRLLFLNAEATFAAAETWSLRTYVFLG